jgi:hypothetical protein
MTCNPKWEVIISTLKPGEITNDRPDLVTHVFFGKLQHLLHELLARWWLTFMSLSGRREACPMHTFCSFSTPITNHEGSMNTTAWCLQSSLIRMHTPLFLTSLQDAWCMALVAPSTHIALAWLTAFVQKATLRPSQSTPLTPPAPTQHTAARMMAAHLNGKCVSSRTMHFD